MKDIVDVVVGKPGAISDIKVARQSLSKLSSQQGLSGDKAYVGESQITTPHKKPKKKELTETQKSENKKLSSKRIFVEHLIRVVKIFKTIQERFRLHKSRYQSIFLTVCGLVRLRIGSLILELIKSPDSGATIDVITRHTFFIEFDLVALNPD